MQSGLSQTEVEFVESLIEGETIELFDRRHNLQCRGTVEETAAALGVAWIRTELGERKLLDIREHFVRRFPGREMYFSIALP